MHTLCIMHTQNIMHTFIDRYADVLVHRLLAVAIGADASYPDLLDKNKTQVIKHVNNSLNPMNHWNFQKYSVKFLYAIID